MNAPTSRPPGHRRDQDPAHGHDGLDGHGHDGHSHGHGHDHHHPPASFDRAFAIGIALNLGFVVIEALDGWRIDSRALLADAAHNLSAGAGLVLAWGAVMAGRLHADARHTWGWKRASILAAFVNAVILLVAMGSLGWEALLRLRAPEPTEGATVMAVAAVGIVVNAITALLFMRGSHDLNVRGAFLHMVADALVSAGVVVAGALTLWVGWTWVDPVASLLIALVIVAGTWSLFRQSLHLLFDGVPEHIDLDAVHACLLALPGVTRVDDLHVWATGTSDAVLSAHLVMPEGGADDVFFEHAASELRARFGIGHVTLQPMRTAFSGSCAVPAHERTSERTQVHAGPRIP